MFFSTYVLARKESLATIWLAAHWDKKLTRQDLRTIDISKSVIQIVHPEVPIALRTSGELLVGVVRVYALKVKHLLKDATDATAVVLRTGTVLIASGKGADALTLKGSKKDPSMPSGGMTVRSAEEAAVTLPISQHGAEALCENDFHAILDVLQKQDGGVHARGANSDVVSNDWFTVQPSQFLEVDVAGGLSASDLLQAVMREGVDRRSGSSSKTSGSSVEAARGSGVAAHHGANDADLMLDVGGALPDDLMFDGLAGLADPVRPSAGGDMPFDLFDAPQAGGAEEGTTAAAATSALPRKLKPVNLLDALSTMLTKQEVTKNTVDRSDVVVSGDRRHGPQDATEEDARRTVRNLTGGANPTTTAVPLTASLLPAGLAAVWAAAAQPSVAKALEIETARHSTAAGHAPSAARPPLAGAEDPMLPDDLMAGGQWAGDEPLSVHMEEPADAPAQRRSTRKRGRDDDDENMLLGESAVATLATLRSAKIAQFAQLVAGKSRVEAARTFVDVLALASRQAVRVSQLDPYGPIQLKLLAAQ